MSTLQREILLAVPRTSAWTRAGSIAGAVGKAPGAVGMSLQALVHQGLLEESWITEKGNRARRYRLTPEGRAARDVAKKAGNA